MKKQIVENAKRCTISFIIHNLSDSYGQTLFAGVADAARNHNVNLLCFVGRDLNSPRGFESQANLIYHLAKPRDVDGIIISGSTVGNFITQEEWEIFHNNFRSLPLISIAVPLPALPSMVIDNREAMAVLVRHLLKDHNYKRIAYISGPPRNIEEGERYRGYQEVLGASGIPLDPALVVAGDFELPSGYEAIRILLDERKVHFNALVASNDNMALGAIEALNERGIKVPHEVAVVGFDDIPMSATATPPLTTLHQPIYEMGEKSIKIMCDILKGKTSSKEIRFSTDLVIRESCGCLPFATSSEIRIETQKGLHSDKGFQKKELIAKMSKELAVGNLSLGNKDRQILIDALSQNLQDIRSTLFIRTLNEKLQYVIKTGKNVADWQHLITIIWEYAYGKITKKKDLIQLTNLLDKARCLIAEVEHRRLHDIKLRFEEQARIVREISESLVTRFDLKELTQVIHNELMRIEIMTFYLILYEGNRNSPDERLINPPDWSHLSLAYLNGKKFRLGSQGCRFQSHKLVPSRFLPSERYTLIVMPLYFRTEHFGYAVYQNVPSVAGLTYEALRDQISSALKGVRLYHELLQAKEDSEHHAKRLKDSNLELEQFAYVASHDLQEPLRMVSSYAQLLERRFGEKLDTDAKEFLTYMLEGTQRMHTLINDLLAYSRVSTKAKPFEIASLDDIMKKVLLNLKVAVEEKKASIEQDKLPTIMCDPVQFERLLQNLIGNALKYCQQKPAIHVGARQKNNQWVISIKDNGIGIDPKYHEKIFGIFKRLHARNEYSGTGIGLAVCKKIVERHNGRIWVESEEGKGSTFYFTIADRGDS